MFVTILSFLINIIICQPENMVLDIRNVTTIEKKNYLKHKEAVRTLYISNGVHFIGKNAFEEWPLLNEVIIGDSVISIMEKAFSYCYALETITIGENVEMIGDNVFLRCLSMNKIIIPNSVNSIGIHAFHSCHGLEIVTLSENLEIISEGMFRNCIGLKIIKIPNAVNSIGKNSFYFCIDLRTVIIGESVRTIGNNAFTSCFKLMHIYFLGQYEPHINLNAFHSVPANVVMTLTKYRKIRFGKFHVCKGQINEQYIDISGFSNHPNSDNNIIVCFSGILLISLSAILLIYSWVN